MREGDKESKKSMMQAAYASTFGIALVLGIFGGILIGAWLDRKLGTGNKFAILFLLVGVFAGFRSLYVWIKNTFEDSYEEPVIRRLKDEPHRKRPPAKKIEIRNLVILGIMLLVSLLAMPHRFTLGILVGGVISIINLYWLGRDLRVIFSNLSGTAKSAMMIRYYIRMAATAVVLYFVITELPIDIIGLLVGLSLVVINIVITAMIEFQKNSSGGG